MAFAVGAHLQIQLLLQLQCVCPVLFARCLQDLYACQRLPSLLVRILPGTSSLLLAPASKVIRSAQANRGSNNAIILRIKGHG